MRGKSFPQYDRLAAIFGKDRAKGNLSEDPLEAHVDVDHEEGENNDNVATNGVSQNSPSLSYSQTQNVLILQEEKRAKASDKWAAGLVEIAGTFGSFLEKANERMDNDKQKINEKLLQNVFRFYG